MRLALPAVPSTGDSPSSHSKREPRWWSGWAWGQAAPAWAAAAPPLPATPQPQSPAPLAAAASPASHPLEEPRPVASSQHQAAAPSDPLTLLEWHDSPVPVKLTAARAALRPTLGLLKSWGAPTDRAQLSARADLQLLPCRLSLDLMCKEAVLGGRLSATLPAGRLEYRRRFHLPNGMVLVLGVGAQYASSSSSGGDEDSISSIASRSGSGRQRRHRFKPFLGCQLQFSAGGAGAGDNDEVVVSERGFSNKHRFKLPDRCGGLALPPMEFEVASTLSLPSGIPGLPSSMPTLPSPASLPSLGSAASLQSLQSGLGSGRLASSSHPATPSFPAGSLGSGAAAAASSLPASPFGSPPSPPPTPGTLPSLRLPSYEGAGSSTQGAVAAGEQEQHQQWSLQHASSQHAQHADNHHRQLDERQALQFQIERLALVVRL